MKPNRNESPRRRAENERSVSRALHALSTSGQVHAFLQDICTPAELQAISDRWQVVLALQTDLSYRAIHDKTGVSVTTIGRVARFLTDGAGGYDAALTKLKTSK